ncbi:hypothetical protein KSS87_000505, partial [Heliosperma pusillum]
VKKLQHRLSKELKLNSVLRYALKGPVFYHPPFSSLLPLKAQKLLGELEVVEKEIICLEAKLKRLKISLYKEKKLNKEAEIMQQRKCLEVQLPCKLHIHEERKDLRIWSPFCRMQNAIAFSKTHCDFHNDIGHNTEDCVGLRKEVRHLHKAGYLDHLLPRGTRSNKVNATEQVLPSPPPLCSRVVNVITGGSELCGLTYSAAKRHATETKGDRPEISCRIQRLDLPSVTFEEADAHEAGEHHDALVISLSIGNCLVKKILIDTGSSVNLIMLETLRNMGFDKKDLSQRTVPLVGFSGETKRSLGEITIPTFAGGINKQVSYLVIDGPATYNVILGRPWIHGMRAIPSTYHQCVKFPTPWGVQEIRGDQEEARTCYKDALKATACPPA